MEYLKGLRDKKIFLFGTAGFGGSSSYFETIIQKIKKSIHESNTVTGWYMCQGKMPASVRARYEAMKKQPKHPANIDMLIKNFDLALSHPDETDLANLKTAVH